MKNDEIKISWYGRCCFLLEALDKKILFDPYDRYCNVDIGLIDSDLLISSSTWHDHGHVGASPKAFVITYPGTYKKDGFLITGIEALEDRGSPTVVFNVRFGSFSITNYADFGPGQKEYFDSHVSKEDLEILRRTNIALVRASIKGDPQGEHLHDEIFLDYCRPSIVIPEHYFPESFVNDCVPETEKKNFLDPNIIVNEMIEKLNYSINEVDDYQTTILAGDLKNGKLIKFLTIHPQVRYKLP